MLQDRLREFMRRFVLPQNGAWHRSAQAGAYPSEVIEPLKARARP